MLQIKGTWSKKRNVNNVNPFDKGSWFKNCYYVLCAPIPPSYIDRRGYVDEDEIVKKSEANNAQVTFTLFILLWY